MNHRRKDTTTAIQLGTPTAELCCCLPLAQLHLQSSWQEKPSAALKTGVDTDGEKFTPAPQELNLALRARLATFFPRTTPLGLLLLHVVQLEHIHINPQSAVLHKRQRYHPETSFLEQVLVNVRRAIRSDDQLLIHKGAGAAIIFPDVDLQGMDTILERVYRNVSLLQAETVIPPLRRETDIVMGTGSYPESGASLEQLLYHVSEVARRFTLRPAITTQLWSMAAPVSEEKPVEDTHPELHSSSEQIASHQNVPFLRLPARIPTRLKQLIPYTVAVELRCAPVGRDAHYLTVAMVDPTDARSLRYLRELTGLTIFPVACDITDLNRVLSTQW